MASDLRSLQVKGSAAFSRKDIELVLWAGVFGSFAVGKQRPDSDVDVVIIHASDYDPYLLPFTAPLLEDLLPEAWGREVDLIHLVSGKELRGYVSIESLLCSQTIYGSIEEPSVAAVLQNAQTIFDTGFEEFNRILDDIRKLKDMTSGVSSTDFNSSTSIRETVRESMSQILKAITAHPPWHPMNEGFWFVLIQQTVDLQKKMHALEAAMGTAEGSDEFWQFVWHNATTTTKLDGINGLGIRIKQFVFSIFDLTRDKAAKARELAGARVNSSSR